LFIGRSIGKVNTFALGRIIDHDWCELVAVF